jgi:hypothetical protein
MDSINGSVKMSLFTDLSMLIIVSEGQSPTLLSFFTSPLAQVNAVWALAELDSRFSWTSSGNGKQKVEAKKRFRASADC